ncbi:hypothetical protein CS535_09630 [Yersinia massiliensis]|nr:hypothetical protein B4902_13310 [Yersinia frederiksenii]PHZ24065.1 hypothetical protein CS535_09630 [Yersinia massiliensis]
MTIQLIFNIRDRAYSCRNFLVMSDANPAIAEAYDSVVQKLYQHLLDAYINHPDDLQSAEQPFTNGLSISRQVKDRAIQLAQQ